MTNQIEQLTNAVNEEMGKFEVKHIITSEKKESVLNTEPKKSELIVDYAKDVNNIEGIKQLGHFERYVLIKSTIDYAFGFYEFNGEKEFFKRKMYHDDYGDMYFILYGEKFRLWDFQPVDYLKVNANENEYFSFN